MYLRKVSELAEHWYFEVWILFSSIESIKCMYTLPSCYYSNPSLLGYQKSNTIKTLMKMPRIVNCICSSTVIWTLWMVRRNGVFKVYSCQCVCSWNSVYYNCQEAKWQEGNILKALISFNRASILLKKFTVDLSSFNCHIELVVESVHVIVKYLNNLKIFLRVWKFCDGGLVI